MSLVHSAAPQSTAPVGVHSGQAPANAPLGEGSAPPLDAGYARLLQRTMLALKQANRALPDSHEVLASYCDDLYHDLRELLGRDGEHCMCDACKNGCLHASDCAVHNEPAMPAGPCDCTYDALAKALGQVAPTPAVPTVSPASNEQSLVDKTTS